MPVIYLSNIYNGMSILHAISIVYIAGEYDGPPFCTPIGYYNFCDKLGKAHVMRIFTFARFQDMVKWDKKNYTF